MAGRGLYKIEHCPKFSPQTRTGGFWKNSTGGSPRWRSGYERGGRTSDQMGAAINVALTSSDPNTDEVQSMSRSGSVVLRVSVGGVNDSLEWNAMQYPACLRRAIWSKKLPRRSEVKSREENA